MAEPITFDELMGELDKYRTTPTVQHEYTAQQDEFIRRCRDNKMPVPYRKMITLWERAGWGKIGRGTLQDRWTKLSSV